MRQKRREFMRLMVGMFCVVMALAAGCKPKENEIEVTEIVTEEPEQDQVVEEVVEDKIEEIYVYVCGEVRNPGVYKLTDGDRITHAVLAAGGMTDQAADTFLNQAEILTDGQKIYVPNLEEVEAIEQSTALVPDAVSDEKVNINTADKAELTTLSGIGESRAEAIISYRESQGEFETVEEIKNVEGIKERIFESIKDQIKVR